MYCCGISAQVSYYKGEWTKVNSQENFSALVRLDVKDSLVTGEIIWTFIAIDSTNGDLVKYYKGQKGKMGIENVKGMYSAKTHDIQFEGMSKTDPDLIIGMDKYLLKLSADKMVIYGRTLADGENNGLVYFYKTDSSIASKEFKALKTNIQSKLSRLGSNAAR
jgi:hypothetical protein